MNSIPTSDYQHNHVLSHSSSFLLTIKPNLSQDRASHLTNNLPTDKPRQDQVSDSIPTCSIPFSNTTSKGQHFISLQPIIYIHKFLHVFQGTSSKAVGKHRRALDRWCWLAEASWLVP